MARPCRHRHHTAGCKYCHLAYTNPRLASGWDGVRRTTTPAPPPKPHGPGTELKALLASLGLHGRGCACDGRASLMDSWGVAGCKERRQEVVSWLREEYRRRGWAEVMGAGIKAWLQGNLSVTDPVGALVDEAIARAEAKERLVQEERLRPAPGVPVAVQHQTADVSIPTTRPTPERGGGVLTWSYCVTTVPARLHTLLPRTLASLATGGFDEPRLVVDSCDDPAPYRATWPRLPVTCRGPANSPVRTAGNWVLALYEIYLRNPSADRYAVFQDDLVTAPGLRAYLEKVPYPLDGRCYLNLYTFPANQELCPKDQQGNPRVGWYESNQLGRGAVALVFSQEAVEELLSSRYLARRPKDPNRGHKAVDGGIVEAMKKVGFREMVHNPGLVQHTGVVSSMGNRPHQQCPSFPGEGFDLTTLLTTSSAA